MKTTLAALLLALLEGCAAYVAPAPAQPLRPVVQLDADPASVAGDWYVDGDMTTALADYCLPTVPEGLALRACGPAGDAEGWAATTGASPLTATAPAFAALYPGMAGVPAEAVGVRFGCSTPAESKALLVTATVGGATATVVAYCAGTGAEQRTFVWLPAAMWEGGLPAAALTRGWSVSIAAEAPGDAVVVYAVDLAVAARP